MRLQPATIKEFYEPVTDGAERQKKCRQKKRGQLVLLQGGKP